MSHENSLLKNIVMKKDVVKMWIMEKRAVPDCLSYNDVSLPLHELKKEGKLIEYSRQGGKWVLVFNE